LLTPISLEKSSDYDHYLAWTGTPNRIEHNCKYDLHPITVDITVLFPYVVKDMMMNDKFDLKGSSTHLGL